MNFVNEKGESTKLSTSKLPGYKIMINPRVGFNYDVNGDKSVQIRGGAGLFTGPRTPTWERRGRRRPPASGTRLRASCRRCRSRRT